VSVADDGRSSGALRATTGLPAVGDLRRCLTALAGDRRAAVAAALERRYDGHAAGNLLLAALAEETGDLETAVREVSSLLEVTASVLPATSVAVDLIGALAGGATVRGQVAVESTAGIVGVELDPAAPPAPSAAVEAVLAADQIVLGPGSLYGSVLAALSPALRDAVARSEANVVLVCNLRARDPETAGYDVGSHVDALHRHGIEPHAVVCHEGGLDVGMVGRPKVVTAPVARPDGLAHDPERLAGVLRDLL
jgi:uncharacterized cofD-like protein